MTELFPRLRAFLSAFRQLPQDRLVLAELDRRQRAVETERLPPLEKIGERLPMYENLVQSVPAMQRNAAHETARLRDNLDGMNGLIGFLLGRVEFVRRELMFEIRYGATAPLDDANRLRAKTEILSPEKLTAAKANGLRLNLGCGHVPLDGCINVDRRALPGVDIVAEADNLPFSPGEVDEILSAHMIEHFPQEQLRRELLPYWVSLLKPGGALRAVVPDADAMIKAYTSGEYPFERLREVTFGSQDYDGDFHYNMLTTASLSELLAEAGMTDVEVIAENRENGGCKEFELLARRPVGP